MISFRKLGRVTLSREEWGVPGPSACTYFTSVPIGLDGLFMNQLAHSIFFFFEDAIYFNSMKEP